MGSTDSRIPVNAVGLREISASELDLRPENEILAELQSFRPVQSEKNLWAFWDKGIDHMYPVYLHTVICWVRRMKGWTVRVVDVVEDSPNNVYKFLDASYLPDCFNDGTLQGYNAPQNKADLVRLPLLYEHGGVWSDVGNMLLVDLDTLLWDKLRDDSNEYEMFSLVANGIIREPWGSTINNLIGARKGSVFIKNWHDGYKELWRGRTNVDGFHKHPLIQEVGLAVLVGNLPGFENLVEFLSDYGAQILVFDRIRNLVDVRTKWSGREYYEKKVFLIEGVEHAIRGTTLAKFDGQAHLDLLTTRLDDPDGDKRHRAESFILEVLSKSYFEKLYHHPAARTKTLADLLKLPGNKQADRLPGTYGELFRYGTVHWESDVQVEQLFPPPSQEPLIYATPTEPAQCFN